MGLNLFLRVRLLQPRSADHIRIIEYAEIRNNWGYSITSRDEKNNILLKAITLYLNEKKIKFKEAKVSLVSIHDSNYQYNNNDDDKEANTPAGQLSKYKLTLDPPVNQVRPTEIRSRHAAPSDPRPCTIPPPVD